MQVLQFIDLGGHEKFLKTALFGMTCLLPDYVILAVAAVQGVDRGTLEHLAAAITLRIPTVIVQTKARLWLLGAAHIAASHVVQSCMHALSTSRLQQETDGSWREGKQHCHALLNRLAGP